MGTATDCHKRVSGEDATFHDLSAGRFTLIIPIASIAAQANPSNTSLAEPE
jgi:hypothetical protein